MVGDGSVGNGVDPVAAIDAAVVEDDHDDGQPVAADGLQLHAGEPERAVAFDRHDRRAAFDGGGDRIAHADSHDAPGAAVEAVPRH